MFVPTKGKTFKSLCRAGLFLTLSSPLMLFSAPTWKKVSVGTGGGGSSITAPLTNCLTKISSTTTLDSDMLNGLPESVQIQYLIVGGGGGPSNGGALGTHGQRKSGTFMASNTGTSFTVYVGGGGGRGGNSSGDEGGGGGAGYYGGGGAHGSCSGGGGGGGGSSAILWNGSVVDTAYGGDGGGSFVGLGGTGVAGGAAGTGGSCTNYSPSAGTQFNGGRGGGDNLGGPLGGSGLSGGVNGSIAGGGGGYGSGGGGGSNGDDGSATGANSYVVSTPQIPSAAGFSTSTGGNGGVVILIYQAPVCIL